MNKLGIYAFAGSLAIFAASTHAVTIYEDDFSGSSAANLFGTTPDVANAHNEVGAGSTWGGNNGLFKADGSVTGTSGSGNGVWLPFSPASGNVYTLSASVDTTGGQADVIPWIALGYAQFNGDDHFLNSGANGYGSLLLRETRGALDGFFFVGIRGGGSSTVDTISGFNRLAVILDASDASSANWTVEFLVNGSSWGGPTFVSSGSFADISYVGFSRYQGSIGNIDDLSLTVVPEPSTGVFASLGILGLALRRRRWNRAT